MNREPLGMKRSFRSHGRGSAKPSTPRDLQAAFAEQLTLSEINGASRTPSELLAIAARAIDLAMRLMTIEAAGEAGDGNAAPLSFEGPVPHVRRKPNSIAVLEDHPLSPASLQLLGHLYRYPGVFMTRAELGRICGAKSANTKCIDVYVSRLRKALSAFGVEKAILTGRKSYAMAPEQRSGVEGFLRQHMESRDILFASLGRNPVVIGGENDAT